jgi:hypothetical protein
MLIFVMKVTICFRLAPPQALEREKGDKKAQQRQMDGGDEGRFARNPSRGSDATASPMVPA